MNRNHAKFSANAFSRKVLLADTRIFRGSKGNGMAVSFDEYLSLMDKGGGWFYYNIGYNYKLTLIYASTKWPPFRDHSFKCIFVNEKFRILIKISLEFVPRDELT